MLFMGLLEVVGIASIMPFMGLLSNPAMINENQWMHWSYTLFGFESTITFLVALGLLVLGLFILSNAFSAFTTWLIFHFVANQNYRIAKWLLENYVAKPYIYFLSRNTSDLGKNILMESAMLSDGVVLPLVQLLAKSVVVTLVSVMLIWVDPIVTLTMGIVLGSAYAIVFYGVRYKIG